MSHVQLCCFSCLHLLCIFSCRVLPLGLCPPVASFGHVLVVSASHIFEKLVVSCKLACSYFHALFFLQASLCIALNMQGTYMCRMCSITSSHACTFYARLELPPFPGGGSFLNTNSTFTAPCLKHYRAKSR